MRVKRAKQYQKNMNVYVNNFKFREPFQILINGDIVKTSLESKLPLVEQLKKAVGNIKILISNCSLQDLRNEGNEMIGGVVLARKFERRRCNHSTPVPGKQCIEDIIGNENTNNYCVAAQDQELRARLRKVPGIPLFHINRSTLILEPISTSTKSKVKRLEDSKLEITKGELERLKAVSSKAEPIDKTKLLPRKIKKPKGPNPLSVKKSKATKPAKSSSTGSENSHYSSAKKNENEDSDAENKGTSEATSQGGKSKRKRKRAHSKPKKADTTTQDQKQDQT